MAFKLTCIDQAHMLRESGCRSALGTVASRYKTQFSMMSKCLGMEDKIRAALKSNHFSKGQYAEAR